MTAVHTIEVVADNENLVVSLNDMKNHLRVDLDTDDSDITTMINAAEQHAEKQMGRTLLQKTIAVRFDDFPENGEPLELPRPPFVSLQASDFTYVDSDGETNEVDANTYFVDDSTEPARLVLEDGESWPTDTRDYSAVRVEFEAGYGGKSDDVPDRFKVGIRYLVSHWYDVRQTVEVGRNVQEVPLAVKSIFRGAKVSMF